MEKQKRTPMNAVDETNEFTADEFTAINNKLYETINADLPAELLRESLSDYHAYDIAKALPFINKPLRLRLYTILSNQELSDIFAYLDNPAPFTEELSHQKMADIIEEMASDEAVEVLEELEADDQKEILQLLDEETTRDINIISTYSSDELGSLITNDFVSIKSDFTVKQAMKAVIKGAEKCENITIIYVTTQSGEYVGAIELKDLFIARADSPLEDIIATSYPCFNAHLKTDEVIEQLKGYLEESLPVIDDQNKLIGVITGVNLADEVESQMQEDYAKFAGIMTSNEERANLLKNLVLRLPWLIVLLLLGMTVSSLISMFDHLIAILPLVAFFQPMILGMSGNAGTQALGVTLINLAKPNSKVKNTLVNETKISFINGLFLAVISFVLLGVYILIFKHLAFENAFILSACIGFALLVSTTVSGFCGCLIPILFKKIKVDPATASGPLITTASDLVSSLTYYGIIALTISFFVL